MITTRRSKYFFAISTLIAASLAIPLFVGAQTADPAAALLDSIASGIPTPDEIRTASVKGSIGAQITPEIPGPNEQASITLTSSLADLSTASISWTLNGKSVGSGRGQKTLTFSTGGLGTVSTVTASVTTLDGIFIGKTFVFRPLVIVLDWEADTYTPPFYRGKALPSPRAGLRVVSTIQGTSLSPKSFVYQWRKNGLVVPEISGYGASTVTVPQAFDHGGNTIIEVTATSLDGSFSAKKSVTIASTNPQPLLYQELPLEGVTYQSALGANVLTAGNELTVHIEPYFAPLADWIAGKILYRWTANGAPLLTATLSPNSGLSGEYGPNRLTLINNDTAAKTISLSFGAQNSANMEQLGNMMLGVGLGGKSSSQTF
ncbi:MAG: hypothetical protein A2675_00055 [Candidatus Yonathbacteria bacterium RIFCSPHIGHO2_01_FULL_51_10]|uniref:Ig-like domain-containing protein n=1 Tax=Candidatus Yonathbacteria bacterium RIFCSPHIGHO2_01_FULL_51_10 TaxID=1802723 RepID=A0A1G2S9K5_9BACT|nr:MAG: hypothetical protein A2675_00055 [Candidatus Yonathbacteria bacterium RIFCSPHIGHO2_01_FULL_51_10]